MASVGLIASGPSLAETVVIGDWISRVRDVRVRREKGGEERREEERTKQ